jgi:hypothetical protein
MKNFLSLFCIVMSAVGLNAQTITSGWAPTPGNQTRQIADALSVSFGSSGSGQSWDFSAALIDSSSTVSFVNSSGAPGSQFYAGATIVESSTYTGAQLFNYYKGTASSYENLGVYSGNGVNYDVALDAKKLLEFPMSYLTTFTDEYVFQRYVSGSNGNNVVGSLTATVDASGTLVFPGGASISDVLRIKYDETYSVTPTFPLPPPYPSGTQTTYIWVSPSYPGVILASWSTGTFDGLTIDPTFYFSIPSAITSINNTSLSLSDIKVNVRENSVFFSLGDNNPYSRLTISNMAGQIISEKNIENANSAEFSTETMCSGVLFCTLSTSTGQHVSGRISIVK